MRFLPNAFSDGGGDSLATNGPLYLLGNITIIHVNSATGTDGAGYGVNPERPFATLAYAYSTCSGGEYIVLADGHTETFGSALTISTALTIIGLGDSGGNPTVKLTNSAAADILLNVTGTDVSIRNVWFAANTAANTTKPVVKFAGQRNHVRNCYFECGANNGYPALQILADTARVELCDFVSTGTGPSALPRAAIYVSVAVSDLRVTDVLVDGGSFGWSGLGALGTGGEAVGLVSVTRLTVENLSLIRGSDASVSSSTGYISGVTSTGESEVQF